MAMPNDRGKDDFCAAAPSSVRHGTNTFDAGGGGLRMRLAG